MVTAMTQYTTDLSYGAISQVVNEEVLIMPMIETEEGVKNVEYVDDVQSGTVPLTDTGQLQLRLG